MAMSNTAPTVSLGVRVTTGVLRAFQIASTLTALALLAGALAGGVNVLAFLALGVFALVLLGFVGVLELGVRGLKGWST